MGRQGGLQHFSTNLNPLSYPPLTESAKRQKTNRETITALPIFDKPPGDIARVATGASPVQAEQSSAFG